GSPSSGTSGSRHHAPHHPGGVVLRSGDDPASAPQRGARLQPGVKRSATPGKQQRCPDLPNPLPIARIRLCPLLLHPIPLLVTLRHHVSDEPLDAQPLPSIEKRPFLQ